ncbi:metal-dependent hydrolase [Bacillus sp. SD088]|uniref:metal-dependent hydrolase n=1 Tax=Bacillus sp. SD088 TaxID=2782012 RepID=UPI001A966748|nr:metal-dependent hydrolase [Bacillus sp. SD088]MBO0995103.1 metal-dependent hydrolase [Bacillus sp. SD088]
MDGKTHFIAGALIGFGVAQYTHVDLVTTASFTLLGGFSGLVPDLDVSGVLARKLSINKKWAILVLGFIGLYLMSSSFLNPNTYWSKKQGILLGSGFLIFPPLFMKQKWMLTLTGILVGVLGFYYSSVWMIMFGIYIGIASLLPHRSLTHSLLGLFYFATLGHYMEREVLVEGLMFVCTGAYASHLILDMKWIPKNRKGVKLFLPFSKVEL